MGREWIAVSTGTPVDDVSVHVASITVLDVGDVQAAADHASELREAARQAEIVAAEAMRDYAKTVTKAGIPVRDIAYLLDVSPQRISQLAN